jgi:hypothetical protein
LFDEKEVENLVSGSFLTVACILSLGKENNFCPAPGSPAAKPQSTWVKDANGWSVRVKPPTDEKQQNHEAATDQKQTPVPPEKRSAEVVADDSKETKRSRTEKTDENICETLGMYHINACSLVS